MFCTAVDGDIPVHPRTFKAGLAKNRLMYFFCEDESHAKNAWNALPSFRGGIKSLQVWFALKGGESESVEWSPAWNE
jgi:hypothetical protein